MRAPRLPLPFRLFVVRTFSSAPFGRRNKVQLCATVPSADEIRTSHQTKSYHKYCTFENNCTSFAEYVPFERYTKCATVSMGEDRPAALPRQAVKYRTCGLLLRADAADPQVGDTGRHAGLPGRRDVVRGGGQEACALAVHAAGRGEWWRAARHVLAFRHLSAQAPGARWYVFVALFKPFTAELCALSTANMDIMVMQGRTAGRSRARVSPSRVPSPLSTGTQSLDGCRARRLAY